MQNLPGKTDLYFTNEDILEMYVSCLVCASVVFTLTSYLPVSLKITFGIRYIIFRLRELEMDSDGNQLIDFEEFQRVTVPAVKNYFNKMRKTVPRLRSRNSDQAWMFHDEARYPLLADFHGR